MNDKKDTKIIEDLQVELTRPTNEKDKIAPIRTIRELLFDPIYVSLYKLFYDKIPPKDREVSKEELDENRSN